MGESIFSSSHDKVEDRDKDEAGNSYLGWFRDQPPPKVMSEWSAKGPIDRETKVRIKQTPLEVEENYRSTHSGCLN